MDTAPVPLPSSRVFACMLPHPVPPFAVGSIPVMSAVKSISDVATVPAVAFRKPERLPTERFDVKRLVEDAVVENRVVVVAFVVVPFVNTAVLGVVAPIGVLLIVPPDIVRLLSTFASTNAVPLHTPEVIVPTWAKLANAVKCAALVVAYQSVNSNISNY